MRRKLLAILITAILVFTMTACSQVSADPSSSAEPADIVTDAAVPEQSGEDSEDTQAEGGGVITLNGDSVSYTGAGITASGSTVTIEAPGDYNISGTLADGQIIINTSKEDKVNITLNGVTVSCSTSAPFYVKSAKEVTVSLAEGTVNNFADTANYMFAEGEDEPNACFFSKDDLTIKGKGSLNVTGSYDNGICSKNDLDIKGGDITVYAINDGLRGKDSVQISGGTVGITTIAGDGIDSNNSVESDRGFVMITGGIITIDSGKHGIKADNYVVIMGGELHISAVDNGIKANLTTDETSETDSGYVLITGGAIVLSAVNNGIRADNYVTVAGGKSNITAGNYGIKAATVTVVPDTDIYISSVKLNIYEEPLS